MLSKFRAFKASGQLGRAVRISTLTCASLLAIGISNGPVIGQEVVTYQYDALGRLTGSSTSGGTNSGRVTGTCFDPAGNRARYDVATSTPSPCPIYTPGPIPTPTRTPTPTPNQAPVANSDSASIACYFQTSVNLTFNDTDPDGNTPLTVESITRIGGTATVTVQTASSVLVTTAAKGSSSFSYVVADSLGATATGSLSVLSTSGPNCQTGPGTDLIDTPVSWLGPSPRGDMLPRREAQA